MNVIRPKDYINNYQILEVLGKGSYGEIFSVRNETNNNIEVFKVLRNEPKFEESQINEINILKKLTKYYNKNCDNKREYISLFIDDFFYDKNHIIVQKKYSHNLYQEYIKRKIPVENIKRIIFDILIGLQFLKINKIIHADIKPENILFLDDRSYKCIICDFSLSKDLSISFDQDKDHYILQSIWYRAPEIIFRNDYDYNIDLWSLGCIIYEIYFSTPLFSTKTEADLFSKIFCLLGTPSIDIIKSSHMSRKLFNLNYELTYQISPIIENKMKIHQRNLNMHCSSNTLKTLMVGILNWDPKERMSIDNCIKLFKN